MSYESDIQSDILSTLKKWKWWAHKNRPGTDGCPRGWPDLTVYLPTGRVVLLEVKRPGESQSPIQRYVMSQLIQARFPVYVVDNHGHAVRVLKKEYERGSGADAAA